MKTFFSFILFFMGIVNSNAQTTTIPDQQFEQILINQGIDSDGTLNGQVLTSDIVGVLNLNLEDVQDLTGLQDFAALEYLKLYEGGPGTDLTVDLTANTNLKQVEIWSFAGLFEFDLTGLASLEELILHELQGDVMTMPIDSLDLSTNTNIDKVDLGAMHNLRIINLLNGNNANMLNFILSLSIDFQGLPPWKVPMCIKVDDATAAMANTTPYDSWIIDGIDPTFYDSGVCTLSINDVEAAEIAFFPNPATDFLNIHGVQPKKIEVYSLQGKKVKSLSADLERIDIRGLSPGMYFVKLNGKERIRMEKIIKK